MPKVKMRAPENFGGLTLHGYTVDVGHDGAYHADHRDVATLRAHGFAPWPAEVAEPNKDVRTMTHGELVEHALARFRSELEQMDTETLRRHALREAGEDVEDLSVPTDAEIAQAKVDANDMTAERISTMKRSELFAYLKAEGVSVSPPITNDRLREIALETLKAKQTA